MTRIAVGRDPYWAGGLLFIMSMTPPWDARSLDHDLTGE